MNGPIPAVGDTPWLDPRIYHPPRGRKMFLLTAEGIAIVGVWTDEGRYCGWRPLFKETPEIKLLRVKMRGY